MRVLLAVGGLPKTKNEIITYLTKRTPVTKRKRDMSEMDKKELAANNEILGALTELGKHEFLLMPPLEGERQSHKRFKFPGPP
jgi:hypothetical protein